MRGLDPRIHLLCEIDRRVKPGDDVVIGFVIAGLDPIGAKIALASRNLM
jgi:hypothetical protein